MKLATLFFLLVTTAAPAATTQWMLRFPDVKNHYWVQTGCYGTASYSWVGPSAASLKAVREVLAEYLKEHAENEGDPLVWTMNQDPEHPENRFAVDLRTGEIVSLPEVGGERKALVICSCPQWNLRNCDRSGALGPLAGKESFLIRTP